MLFVTNFLHSCLDFFKHAKHNNNNLEFGHYVGLQVQGKAACPICWLQLKCRYSCHLHKTVYAEFRQFLPLGHPFREELKHFFNGIAELDEPPFRCGAADWKIIWENENNTTNGIFVPPPGMKRLSIFHELEYWHVLKINHLLDPMHIFKNVCKSLLTHLSGDLDTMSSRQDLELSNTKEILWRPTVILENGKMVYQTTPYVLTRAEQKDFFSYIKNIRTPSGFGSLLHNAFNTKERFSGMSIFNVYICCLSTIVVHRTIDCWILCPH